MERKIINHLLKWKNSQNRKPLLLLGARQVGKTWAMRHFGEREFQNVAYVNCDEQPLAKHLFDSDYDIPRIILAIQAITGTVVQPGKTLIILDELQEVPRGLNSLKYFQENAPQYHVIAAGSLLGITLKQGESFPVGKINMLHMYPMDFEEFLLAIGEEGMAKIFHQDNWEIIDILKTKFIDTLRQYYYVGGMPEVVANYIEQKDLTQVRVLQSEILETYRRDISKHTLKRESILIGQVLNSLPSQLVKENKKFIYNVIREGARAKSYELAIQWLIDAGIVHKVSRVSKIEIPIKFYEDIGAFKLFLLDLGLLGCMIDAPASLVLVSNDVFKEFKGALTEQYVLQQLIAMGIMPYYWSKEKTPAEIDFVVQSDSHVIPIEVKAEENVRARSLIEYIKTHPKYPLKGLRIYMKGYKDQEWMENIPLYGMHKYFSKED
ncbi:MAG: ATP-binding protein [Prevotella sp.]|nr:ATP-binding protein [Prevotella sp.]